MSSVNNYHHDTMPGIDILKRYRELGGVYVTVGSDSHYFQGVGFGIQQGMEMLEECGFTHFTVFRKRQPILMEIK